ncbi:aminotransferase class IV [Clostridium grantii]|uniref:Branched-chain amino acid aminotransferase n=1 Tax=Clostridium grantii DSM 8605 TaxID=1121316 RepID=A0A1M5SK79_9CLOT|nr:aminotransferase class IV [Clostridium grantii]SHH38313.1 branched-chain amino acid aminotransferase [Clostridium grantii DSM 8605]
MEEYIGTSYLYNDEAVTIKEFDVTNVLMENSIYEVFRVMNGVPLFIEQHFKRLKKSFELIDEKINFSLRKLKSMVKKLCDENNIFFGNVKLVCNIAGEKKFFLYFIKTNYPSRELYEQGVKTCSFNLERDNPNAKLVKGNYKKLVQETKIEKNVFELILVDNHGFITEGSISNTFMIKDNKVITALNEKVLKGITRDYVFEICRENNIEIIEMNFHISEIEQLNAMFITGTSPKILPIQSLDYKKYSTTDKILRLIMNEYDKKINEYIKNYTI